VTAAGLGQAQMMPVAKIRPYPNNPRKITDKAVQQTAASIREFGWQQPIVVDGDLVVIIGHVRRLAAISLGEEEAPVIIETRLSPEQVKALRIADNRASDYTTWDYALLAGELEGMAADFGQVLDLADWEETVAGFQQASADGELGLSDRSRAVVSGEHQVTVIFGSKIEADQAGPKLAEIPGVVFVRYPT
jgi:ParB-like chromosome segregation protein Spo0J